MSLDPAAKSLLELISSIDTTPVAETTPQTLRGAMKLPPDAVPVVMAKIEDVVIAGSAKPIDARIYVPRSESDNLPLCMFYHGGGFVVGDLVDYDSWCRRVADKAGTIIVSVNYALAPEYKFPQGPDDCYQAFLWAHDNASDYGGDNNKIAVMGDSAGGTMAAVVCQRALADNGPAICHQMLIYPVTDFNFDTPSYIENGEGYFLTRERMQWFWHHYLLTPEQGALPYASPIRSESLQGLPSATVITAEYDPLLDEGKNYCDKLAAHGVETTYRLYPGMIHGFVSFINMLEQADESIDFIAGQLRQSYSKVG
jgi:acetyl esterase